MKRNKKGFSLVELLVALTLFSIVALMGTSAVLIIVASNRTSQSISAVLSNLSLSLEGMSRNIRVGNYYHCSPSYSAPPSDPSLWYTYSLDCPLVFANPGSNPQLTFLSEDGVNWFTYIFNPATHSINKLLNGVDQGSIIAPEITVNSLNFYVSGSQGQTNLAPNKTQPRAVIVITGFVDNGQKGKVPFNIQTTVSQRLIQ